MNKILSLNMHFAFSYATTPRTSSFAQGQFDLRSWFINTCAGILSAIVVKKHTERIILSLSEKSSMLIWLCTSQFSPCFLLPAFFFSPSAASIPLKSSLLNEHCEPFIWAFEDLVFWKYNQKWFNVTHRSSTSTCSSLGFLKSVVSKLGRFFWSSLFCADLIFPHLYYYMHA